MKFRTAILTASAVFCFSPAFADGYDLANKNYSEFQDLAGASVADGDFMFIWDTSANNYRKTSLEGFAEVTSILDGVTATAAEINRADIATLGTLAASKLWSSDASLDTVMPTGGLLTVQSGGGLTLDSGSTLTVNAVAVNKTALSLPGRATITVCGDATTVNNNTVYYGPSMVVAANGIRTCNIAGVGNVTEATADELAFTDTAFQVLSWYCLQPDAGANLTYTLRSAEAALTPANAITINDNALSGSSTTATTTAIASGATFAIAVSSTSDVGTAQFACHINVAY
jgi:hypothetical protein